MDFKSFDVCLVAFLKCKIQSPVMDDTHRENHIKTCYQTLNLCLEYSKKYDTRFKDTGEYKSTRSTLSRSSISSSKSNSSFNANSDNHCPDQ